MGEHKSTDGPSYSLILFYVKPQIMQEVTMAEVSQDFVFMWTTSSNNFVKFYVNLFFDGWSITLFTNAEENWAQRRNVEQFEGVTTHFQWRQLYKFLGLWNDPPIRIIIYYPNHTGSATPNSSGFITHLTSSNYNTYTYLQPKP